MQKITLKAARVNSGLSQKEAAKKLGVAASTLYKWEAGINNPNVKYIDRIERVFDIPIENINF